MKVYISLPITGHPYEEVCKRAEEAERIILSHGDIPVNPLTLSAPGLSWAVYLRTDLAALITCDAIMQLRGHKGSRGCRIESIVAHACQIKPYTINKIKS